MKKTYTKSDSWVDEHYLHCHALTLERDFIEQQLPLVESRLAGVAAVDASTGLDMSKQISAVVCESLKKNLHSYNRTGLLCSGGEDSVYLLITLINKLSIKPVLFCYETKNNKNDVRRLRAIAEKETLELHIFDSNTLDSASAYHHFVLNQNRAPNDIAQPVHNALYTEAIENFDCDKVVDGQFCDTVLMSNPQNHFLLWIRSAPWFFSFALKLLGSLPLPNGNKTSSRIAYLNSLSSLTSEEDQIFSLLNIKHPWSELRSWTKHFISRYGLQLTFTSLFFFCLLEKRERDKYLECPRLVSPFDNFDLALKTNSNLSQVLGLLVRKKPIRTLCKTAYPGFFRIQSTLPFEME